MQLDFRNKIQKTDKAQILSLKIIIYKQTVIT